MQDATKFANSRMTKNARVQRSAKFLFPGCVYSLNFYNFPPDWETLAMFSLVGETIHFKNYMGNYYGFKSYQQ